MNAFTTALIVTALGMGLVFLMITLLWGVITLIARGLPSRSTVITTNGNKANEELILKRKIAAIAVAAALTENLEVKPHEFPLPPTALVSAWQAVMRSEMLKKRGHRK